MFQAKGAMRTERIAVRLTKEERRALARAAGLRSVSDFLRALLMKSIGTKGV